MSIIAKTELSLSFLLGNEPSGVSSVNGSLSGESMQVAAKKWFYRAGGFGCYESGYGPFGYGNTAAAGFGFYPVGHGPFGFGCVYRKAELNLLDGQWLLTPRSYDDAGNYTDSASTFVTLAGEPEPPSNLKAAMAEGNITLSWSKSSSDL